MGRPVRAVLPTRSRFCVRVAEHVLPTRVCGRRRDCVERDDTRARRSGALPKTKREKRIYPAGSRYKCIVSADAVEIVGIHGVDRFSPAHRLGLVVFGGAAEAVRSEAKGDSQPVPLARRFGPGRSLAITARRIEETHFMQPEMGLLHHYRSFDAPPGPEYVVDRYVPTRFVYALLSRIAAARHKLGLAPT